MYSGSRKIWIDVRGIHDSAYLSKLGDLFKIDALALEDIQEVHQRTKIHLYDDGLFALFKNLNYVTGEAELKAEQLAVYIKDRLLISFQEDQDDSFPLIYSRLEKDGTRLRVKNTDYLFYALLDYQIDKYFLLLDGLNDEILELEERVLKEDIQQISGQIFRIRNIITQIRRYVYPLRDDLVKLMRSDSKLIDNDNIKYILDLEDHVIQVIDMIDSQREILNGIKDLAVNQASLSLNKDMKWLAAVSTISIPILFMTGVYGMNFEYMPELKHESAYRIWWGGTLFIVFSLIIYFKRKKML